MGTTNFDTVEAVEVCSDGRVITPISTQITKTVGVGKDFELFHDAMVWATSHTTIGAGEVTLILDGVSGAEYTHEVGVSAEYYINLNLVITSGDLGDKFDCHLTLPSTDDGGSGLTTFTVGRGGDFLLKDVDFNVTRNSYPYATNVTAVRVVDGGRFHIFASNITYCNTAIKVERGHALCSGLGSDEEISYCTNGFIVDGMESSLLIEGSSTYLSIGAVTNELIVTKGGRVMQDDGGSSMLTANIPRNEIQYDGSYYIYAYEANTFKA